MVALLASAQGPNSSGDYYSAADGKMGSALKTALCHIIYSRTEQEYSALWSAFYTTDKRDGDGNKLWDMYSNHTPYLVLGTNQDTGSGGNVEGQYYNREHSFPQSWFGGENKKPMYTDLHHIYPTDKCVNGKRASYPFGETNGETYKSENNFSKLGACTYSGYSGTVFEPADEYKGDFARTYFYMVTCYEEKLHDWYTNFSTTDVVNVLDGNTYPGLKDWQLNMLMAWAAADPVSQKEINRNTAVKNIQGNRNPFIDYPGLEQYIWGSKTDVAFSYDNYDGSGSGSGGDDPGEGSYFAKITSKDDIVSGGTYLIVYEAGSKAFDGSLTTLDAPNNNISVTISDHKIEATPTIMASTFTITAKTGGYSVKSASGYYIGNTSKSNGLKSSTSDSYTNGIAFNVQGNVYIESEVESGSTYLYFNNSVDQSRFRYFTSSQQSIQLYKLVEAITPSLITSDLALTDAPIALTFDLNTNSAAQVIHYTTSSTGAVTVNSSSYVTTSVDASNKTITVTPTAVTPSIQTITVNQAADETYKAGSVTFTVDVDDSTPGPVVEGNYFTKITSLSDLESGGTYLIVYEAGSKAFNGALTTLDADNNNINVTISDSRIEATTEVMSATFTIAAKTGGYSVKSASGYYIGITSNSNSLKSSLTDIYTNTISFNKSTGNVFIEGRGSSPYYYLYFNTSAGRFRFYNNAQKEIQLYKYVAPSSQTVSVGEDGYATMVAEADLEIPSGVQVFAVQINSGYVSAYLEPITGGIPADEAVVVKASKGTYDFIYASEPVDEIEENNLVAATEDVTANGTQYCLANKSLGIGFYKVQSGIKIPKGKAYLVVPGSGNVKAFYGFEEDDATNIRSMEDGRSMMEDGIIYNVAGQRLNKMQKGLNIVGGRKIVGK